MRIPLRTDTILGWIGSRFYDHWKVAYEFLDEDYDYAIFTAEAYHDGIKVTFSNRFRDGVTVDQSIDKYINYDSNSHLIVNYLGPRTSAEEIV
jgi:hypothetical protein